MFKPEQKQEIDINYVHIRFMIPRDMSEVLSIENECFEFPWSGDDFSRCLRQRSCIGMVAEYQDKIIGFMVYELCNGFIHILDFAVAYSARKQKIGTKMANKLIGKLYPQRRTKITLEVRETNLAAQLFFRNCGFRAVKILRNHWDDTPEDAYVMRYRINYNKEKQEEENKQFCPTTRLAG